MGRIIKGANGGFAGKAGSVIGARWRGIDYIKGLMNKSNKAATPEQIQTRERFLKMINVLGKIKRSLEVGFRTTGLRTCTGVNYAMGKNLKQALVGEYPDLNFDFSKLELSTGGLSNTDAASMELSGEREVTVSWNTKQSTGDLTAEKRAKLKAYVFLINEQRGLTLVSGGEKTWLDEKVVFDIPASFVGETLHGYLFFISPESVSTSATMYIGNVNI